jgi:serine/threonine protein phosphatase 1
MKQVHILSVMDGFKNYADIRVGDRRFTMVHGGIAGYSPDKSMDDYGIGELAFGREDYGQPKFNEPGRFLVTGHTPTALIDHESRGRIFKKYDHIAIDCGAVFDISLGCICLDTMEEFYV